MFDTSNRSTATWHQEILNDKALGPEIKRKILERGEFFSRAAEKCRNIHDERCREILSSMI